MRGDYLRASAEHLADRRRAATGCSSDPESLEGFLFPATYELRRGAPRTTLVRQQLAAFRAELSPRSTCSYARRKNLTAYDVVTIASMVEREAQLARERPLVAAVIYNRLKRACRSASTRRSATRPATGRSR